MPLSPGDKFGPYEIVSKLGAGGMGEVYRARDSKLNRDVAIKVLPAALANDAQYMARFEREAQMLAALNHPNIATVYGVEQGALVMELVEGADLKGPLPLDEAIAIARLIAAGLEAAHEKGIIHRDLKPANIKTTPAGGVKILDFGLAKSVDTNSAAPAPSNPTISPTLSMQMTQVGMILGTAAYMSPEQARGKPVDRRTDIWAFGVVMYEVVTGKRLFHGEDLTETLASVVKDRPDLSDVPAQVRRLLERCLEKDPKKRLRDIGDMELLLAEAAPATPTALTAPSRSRLGWLAWAVAGALSIALGISLWALWRATQPVDRPLVRLDVDLGADVSLLPVTSLGSSVAISPDGTRLVYVSGTSSRYRIGGSGGVGASHKLFTRRLDQSKTTELPGAEGVAPFFSADSQWIGFETSSLKLSKISVEGGAVVPLADPGGPFYPGNWSEDGNIYVGVFGKGLVRIPGGGGAPETIAALDNGEVNLAFPQLLPGGKALLFSAYTTQNADASSIEVMTLADHHRKTVSRGGTSPRYLATSNGAGYLVYLNKATVFAIPFDLDKLETRGNAVPILDDVASHATLGTAQLSISRTGTLVYRKSGGDSGLLTVAWLDGAGKTQPLPAKPAVYGRPTLSPDGQRLALEVTEGSGTDIWVYDWQRDTMTRLTFDSKALAPVWTPDGRYIVFGAVGEGMSATRSDGAGKPQPLIQSKNIQFPWSFTQDGKRMAFAESDPKTSLDLWTVPLESDGAGLRAGKPEVFLQTPARELNPVFSPDGQWLAYMSNESGTFQIYVRAFPDKGGKWQISNGGGIYPMWSRSDLFFESLDQHIMAATYRVLGDSFAADKPRLWSDKPIGGSAGSVKNIDLAPDGKRIVALMPAAEAKGSQETQNQVVFLLNFFDELRRRVPGK
jgi:serine/threonine protein kinase